MKIRTRTITIWLPHASLVLVLATLFHQPLATVAEPTDKHGLNDPITGCTVWTEKPVGKAAANWSGGLQDVKASKNAGIGQSSSHTTRTCG